MSKDSESNYERLRVPDGWLDFHRDDEGVWRVSVLPDPLPGETNPPGRTYSPGDPDWGWGEDYPDPYDFAAVSASARRRWGAGIRRDGSADS